MSLLLGDEFPAFAAALEEEPVNGLRVNTLKISTEDFLRRSPFPLGDRIPWAASAYVLPPSDVSPGNHPYHRAGLYYLQDPSAMSAAMLLDPHPGECVLDLAAAPGGKTTHLATLMQGRGLLVANEIKDKRVGHLAMNVERWGAGNVVVTNETPERLADAFGAFFDRVLVDAPCSGEGMFRKDMGARADWSPEMVAGCAVRQRNILRVAAHLVRPGGYLMYSTCTFAPEEDEGVMVQFLDEHPDFGVEALPQLSGFAPGKPEWLEFTTKDKELCKAVRLFPHRVKGEGHFVCLLKRFGEEEKRAGKRNQLLAMNRMQMELWQAFVRDVLACDFAADRLLVRGERLYFAPEELPDFGHPSTGSGQGLRVVHPGIWLGTFKKGRFEPAHPLALFLKADGTHNVTNFQPDDQRLAAYLRGETFASEGAPGWTLVCVDGFGLGWGKRVQAMVKNHYPRGWM